MRRSFILFFDRGQDIAIAGAGRVNVDVKTVVIEGNYVLLKKPALARTFETLVTYNFSGDIARCFEKKAHKAMAKSRLNQSRC